MKNRIITCKISMTHLKECYRVIEITDTSTVAKLAYTVLATFNTAMYHLFSINFNNKSYQSLFGDEDYLSNDVVDSTKFRLFDLKLKANDVLYMEYDFGTTQDFTIEIIKIEDILEKQEENNLISDYPKIIDGYGMGIIEDTSYYEVKEIIENNEKVYALTINGWKIYNFNKYDLKKDNKALHDRLYKATVAYEELKDF